MRATNHCWWAPRQVSLTATWPWTAVSRNTVLQPMCLLLCTCILYVQTHQPASQPASHLSRGRSKHGENKTAGDVWCKGRKALWSQPKPSPAGETRLRPKPLPLAHSFAQSFLTSTDGFRDGLKRRQIYAAYLGFVIDLRQALIWTVPVREALGATVCKWGLAASHSFSTKSANV